MTAVPAPPMFYQFFDSNGVPLAGGQLFTYLAGSSTKTPTWTDSTQNTLNGNPATLDSQGRVAVWLDPAVATKLLLAPRNSADPPTTTLAVADNIRAYNGSIIQTPVELSLSLTPSAYLTSSGEPLFEGDIRRYGATTGSSNNYAAIQHALDVSAAGGNPAYIPPGNWQYTQTLTIAASASMYGRGQSSVLNPNGCDGLQFSAQSVYAGSRFFRGFFIKGTSTDSKYGIRCDLPAGSGAGIIYNLTFEDVTIQNFNRAVSCTGGMWNSVFRKCALYNNFIGFYFVERNIDITLDVCDVERGTITGSGSAYGVYCSVSGGITPESIKINGSLIYGYDIQVSFGQVNFCSILHTDMDNTQSIGVEIATVSGGCTVRDCWIATINASATKGVFIHDLGAPVLDRITIAQNHIICETAHAGSIGVYCGNDQKNIRVLDNDITGWETCVKGNASDNLIVKNNHLSATSICVQLDSASVNNEVGPNFIEAGTSLSFTSSTTPPGLAYYDQGTFAMVLTGMSSGGTGTATWAANGRRVNIALPTTGITAVSTSTAMTATGLPSVLYPITSRQEKVIVRDNGSNSMGVVTLTTAGVMTFFKDVNGAAFTGTGTKGVVDNFGWDYA